MAASTSGRSKRAAAWSASTIGPVCAACVCLLVARSTVCMGEVGLNRRDVVTLALITAAASPVWAEESECQALVGAGAESHPPETSDPETLSEAFEGHINMPFEGHEKKLEVHVACASSVEGFRQLQADVWSGVLLDAACTILTRESSNEFDAYLLSESSLFVFRERIILKTCGTTTLLLVLPKLLRLAEQIGCVLEHVFYGHPQYKFPEQQVYPHGSFRQEHNYLLRIVGNVQARVLGPSDGRYWYVLHATSRHRAAPVQLLEPACMAAPMDGDDIFEMAMEGLSEEVRSHFFRTSHPGAGSHKELADRMTALSGIGALLPGVKVDNWAFEPCGYSMNGLRGGFYYTVHITPEPGVSYASFETNDPQYREPHWVERIAATLAPSALTLTLTTRNVGCKLEACDLIGFERTALEITQLDKDVSFCAMNFARI